MDVTPLIPEKANVIQSYGGDGFKISGDFYGHNLIVTIDQIVGWPVQSFDDLNKDSFSQILPVKDSIDVIFLGTGKTFKMPPKEIRDAWRAQGLRIEPMDTGAACRSYNVLMTDGRRVASALLKI